MKKSNIKSIKKIIDAIESYKDELTIIFEEEEAIIDGRSERWLDSDKGQHATNALSELESAVTSVENLFDELSNSIDSYEE